MTSIIAYENLEGDYLLKPQKEFTSKVPDQMWKVFKNNLSFKFRLDEYTGSDNPVEFLEIILKVDISMGKAGRF